MQDYCQKHKSTEYHRRSQPLGIEKFLDNVRKEAKDKITKNAK